MKLKKQNGSKLSLNKSTIAKLHNSDMLKINAGYAITTDDSGGLPETCGYACTDCMSTLTRPFTIIDVTKL